MNACGRFLFVEALCSNGLRILIGAMSSELPRCLASRLGTARSVLGDVAGTPAHAAASQLQRGALEDLIGKHDLGAATKAYVGEQ